MVKLHAPTQNVLVYGTDGEKALAEGFGRPLHTHCTWCVTYTGRITSLQNWLSWGYQQALLQNIEWKFSVKNIGSKQTAWVDWFLISWGVWWKNAVIDRNVDGTSSSRPTVPVLFPELQAGPIKQTMTASVPFHGRPGFPSKCVWSKWEWVYELCSTEKNSPLERSSCLCPEVCAWYAQLWSNSKQKRNWLSWEELRIDLLYEDLAVHETVFYKKSEQ